MKRFCMKKKNDTWKSGFQRDNGGAKIRYDLIPLEMLERLAKHYTNGAKKYGASNWMLASSPEELARFKQSAWRHFISWQKGLEDEDHASALVWNVFCYECLKNICSSENTYKTREFFRALLRK